MPRSRESLVLTVSQLLRYKLPVLAMCITSVTVVSIHGQKVSSPSGSAATSKSCDGQMPSQASSHQGSPDPQSGPDGAADRLKLSTKGTQESPEADGQFCKREHPGQNSLKPSVKSSQTDETSEPAQPPANAPIAQLTNGKLIIRANGQDFAAVLESIRSVSGFTVEMPPGGESEPVFLNMGPASVTDALVALIEGTNYNYFIVGSAKDPLTVKRLILTERTTQGPATLVASSQGAPVASQPALYGGQGSQADEADASEPPPPPPPPVQPSVVPSSVPTGINVQKLAAESGKTPGQILDELQKRQQQVLDEQAASQSQSAPQ